MAKTVADVMKDVKDNEIKFVDFRLPIPVAKNST